MVTVLIWDPSRTSHGWGHAAIEVNGELLSIGSSDDREPVFPSVEFTHSRLYTSTMRFWSSHSEWPATYRIQITGLDERAMLARIRRFRLEDNRYHTLRMNCTRAVWLVLQAGIETDGADDYAQLWDHQAVYYTPMLLLDYARRIGDRLN